MAGVVLIVGPSFLTPAAPGAALIGSLHPGALAELACLAATFSYACSGIYGRRFRRMEVAPMAAAFGQMAAAAAVMVPLALIIDRPWTLPMPATGPIAALVCIGVVATGLAYIVFYRLLATAGATNLMLVTFLIPAWALLVGWTAFGETLTTMHGIGIAVVGAGLAVIDGRLVVALGRRLSPSSAPRRATAHREADFGDP
ncbi:DMT family transporter [Chelatococcus reniformis]|uniref:EamA domain-containing protein n=1 Tax=Chelatococcus reniformis TaxID=1494448 RepID=A0A916TWK2_9HYPH|nr:DMT family transporter [Chelatococcus reniformis]GGC45647.1 hypothetical protein GCM10010994_01000 [Chelatococcus reniformis]